MGRLPIALSVPHAGLQVPEYLAANCRLSAAEIRADGDVGAREIYDLQDEVAGFVRTDIARAVLDMNRAEGDRRKDGVVKTHTCWDVPVWDPTPAEHLFARLLQEHHRPYHGALSGFAGRSDLRIALDCHTMAEQGPPVGPDPGVPRPMVCIGDADGGSCPRPLVERMHRCLAAEFPGEVTINRPFSGGHITRSHGLEMPWLQIEMSRSGALSIEEKRARFLRAVRAFCAAS